MMNRALPTLVAALLFACGESDSAPNVVSSGGSTTGNSSSSAAGEAGSVGMDPVASAGMSAGGAGGMGGTENTAGVPNLEPPNIVFVLIDDMGYGDLSSYGNPDFETPNIDAVAEAGTRFTQFYVASPICSPSRVAFTTGRVPGRYRVHGHFANRAANANRQMPDFLPADAPAVARQFKAAGYATAHFGKWHQGGGRDVDDAPLPSEYGFDESLVSFEGLGDRVLITGDGLSQQSAELGHGEIQWSMKRDLTEIYIDRAVDFVTRNQDNRFFLHVWLNDVHDPFDPKPELMDKYSAFSADRFIQQYFAVADNMDAHVGRLMATLDDLELADDTLVIISSDNGPTAWPRYYDEGETPPGITDGLRGRKWSLYEGGIREPLIVRWPGKVPAGKVNDTTVLHAVDYLPTIAAIAGVDLPSPPPDGENLSDVFLGADRPRTSALFWEYGHFAGLRPGLAIDQSPPIAMRKGDWKLLMGWDGGSPELYNLATDRGETTNVADANAAKLSELAADLRGWRDEVWGTP